ncbi:hypothetical protein BGK38_08875 [Corynebacterium diphtheriae]|nr:hypothetical protein BGK38_08875 [Corynebacterium diphtheriae]OEH71705.1 hypothetical protein BHU47_10255 [Corynebacterium diphtheriae]OEH72972.1 hypothetical protein BHU48_10660 [Corynebacterium diphtheriae]OLN19550.1 hypothetical protein BUE67_08795 [Corynebacterium diphtheriae]OLO13664.1 hypothetical protein BUV99_10485 [Corynebacterium diphtheriae]
MHDPVNEGLCGDLVGMNLSQSLAPVCEISSKGVSWPVANGAFGLMDKALGHQLVFEVDDERASSSIHESTPPSTISS